MNALMRCEEVQQYLADRLAGSLSDRLSSTVYSHVRTHMLSCLECCEELEDFGEMQKVLQAIPMDPCDSNAMRARFQLLIRTNETESPRSTRTTVAPRIRPFKVAFISVAAVVVVIAALLAVRQAVKRISFRREAPPVSIPATLSSSKPATAAVGTGAISGQIRASDPELLRKIRVSVIAIPKSGNPSTELAVEANTDGKYRLDNIPAGQYYVLARLVDGTMYYPGATDIDGATVVSIQPGAILDGIDFPNIGSAGRSTSSTVHAETAKISGRVLTEDGSEVSDTPSLGEITISPVGQSNSIAATTVELAGNGRFDRTVAAGGYRFRITEFNQNYLVRSMTSRGTDLLKEDFNVSGNSPVPVEIRVARRNDAGAGKILGRVLDSETNAPSQADRVVLCCFPSEPVERISASLRSDGSFEFDGVPSGSYTAELRGGRNLDIVNPILNVGAAGMSGLKLISVPLAVVIDVTLRLDTGGRLPYRPDTSIIFTGNEGAIRVAASCVVGNLFRASVPADGSYALTVSNVAPGYFVQSIVDTRMTDLLHGGLFTAAARPTAPPRIVVTLTRN